ncbi:hypothetical protein J6590_022984 [Homalodisca vitripennis]|nr:hypothetical protein J6590_022984 [Homalodisca vitripennis]
MDYRINLIRQLLEAHIAPNNDAAVTVSRPVGRANSPVTISPAHYLRVQAANQKGVNPPSQSHWGRAKAPGSPSSWHLCIPCLPYEISS